MNRLLIMLILTTIPFLLRAQLHPGEGARLNYRIVGFSFPQFKANHYGLEIAQGYYSSNDSFEKNKVVTATSEKSYLVAEVPSFGCNYTWRVTYSQENKAAKKSELHHFSTIMNDRVDTAKRRLSILHIAETHKDDYVMVEGGGIIYDMKGNPVWCISDSMGFGNNAIDVKFTPQGSITCLVNQSGYDIDYDGHVLWRTPSHDTVSGSEGADFYHHDFTRLSNGHYMILGTEYLWCNTVYTGDNVHIETKPDRTKHTTANGGAGFKNRGRFGTLVEFDNKNHVTWSWKSSKYLLSSDYVNYSPRDTNLKYEPHDNAFYFDEKNSVVYMGFRNLGRIVKIDYPGGKVLAAYGEVFKKGTPQKGFDLFCSQHCIDRTKDGYLMVFNNNSCRDSVPTVVLIKEPVSVTDSAKKVWEYTCTAQTGAANGFPSGGNVMELPDSSLFICMGSDYAKLLIVNRDKKVLWSALPEKYDEGDKKWKVPARMYRANIISRQGLEQMIEVAVKNEEVPGK
jgi:arylsulfotransferase ASST